jgi:anti-sigma B factor antagonist
MTNKSPFSAEMEINDVAGVQIWNMTGKMVSGSCCYEFLDSVRENVAKGQNYPILDMTGISWVNSTGVGVIASIFNAARDAGGAMLLVGPNQRVESILTVVNLWPLVTVFDTLEKALEHLKAQ